MISTQSSPFTPLFPHIFYFKQTIQSSNSPFPSFLSSSLLFNSIPAPISQRNFPSAASTPSPSSPSSSSPQIPRAAADTSTSPLPHPTCSLCRTTDPTAASSHAPAQIAISRKTGSDNESISLRSIFKVTAGVVPRGRGNGSHHARRCRWTAKKASKNDSVSKGDSNSMGKPWKPWKPWKPQYRVWGVRWKVL